MAGDMLQFIYEPSTSEDAPDGWGRGCLLLAGEPYWYGSQNAADSNNLLDWTWVDLLDYLGKNWLAISLEQQYPFSWLANDATHPGQTWEIAERRWAMMQDDDERIDAEESVVLAFMARHNLAQAWQGLSLPQLLWFRTGDQLWLIPERGNPLLTDFHSALAHLEAFGNQLAAPMTGSNNPRVQLALQRWTNRNRYASLADYVSLATGWPTKAQVEIQGHSAANDFWFDAAQDASDFRETEVLAAARMLRFVMKPTELGQVLQTIRHLPASETPKLDQASKACEVELAAADSPHPWEQGYIAANWLRNLLGIAPDSSFHPEQLLAEWNVSIRPCDLVSDRIDALACWGERGPAILVNNRPHAKTRAANRMRSTLAHEIAHLLIDRAGALPVAEVLGGHVDPFVEQRARAFAAELLLPRHVARDVYLQCEGLGRTLKRLTDRFKVSRQLACYQLHNSGCTLAPQDEIELTAQLKQYDATSPFALGNH